MRDLVNKKTFLLILSLNLFYSCAQKQAPDGGAPDDIPPKVQGSKPLNKSVNFNQSKIQIEFDEYIQLKDQSQIVISPILKDKPLITAYGKKIEIEFTNSKPLSNTTYTINFGNSISDNHEGKILQNYSYVFSTGPILDSNNISGTVTNALNNKPEKDITVGIYKIKNYKDTSLTKQYPNYFDKTNEKGEFKLENLPSDTFLILAFKDANSDNRFQKTENLAFLKENIITTENKVTYNLKLFEPNQYKPGTILDTVSRQKHKYQFTVYKSSDIQIQPLSVPNFILYNKAKNNIDTLSIFIPGSVDTIAEKFKVTTNDTTSIISIKTKGKSKTPQFTLTVSNPEMPGDSIHIYSKVPIKSFKADSFLLQHDTLKINITQVIKLSADHLAIIPKLQEAKNYTFTVADSSIQDIYGNFNKTIQSSFQSHSAKEYGNMLLKVTYSGKEPIILHLIEDNESEKIISQTTITGTAELTFNQLKPSNLRIKLIQDKNNNGKWDSGDLIKEILPEPISYFDQTITVKAYWDIEQSINLDKIIIN